MKIILLVLACAAHSVATVPKAVAQTLLMPLDVSPERCSILVVKTHAESSPYCNT